MPEQDTFEDDWETEFTQPFRDAQERLLSLESVNVKDCAEVQRTITTLESLERDLWDFIHESEMPEMFGLDKSDTNALMSIYGRQLKRLKKSEGIDFRTAAESLQNCIRLAGLFLLYMFDWYSYPCHIDLSPNVMKVLIG